MLRLSAAILLSLFVAFTSPTFAVTTKHHHVAAAKTSGLQEYSTERAAQAHCPRDTVVWLNTNSGIYHEKGMRWYGNTREGAYVCRAEADAASDRDTRNGQ